MLSRLVSRVSCVQPVSDQSAPVFTVFCQRALSLSPLTAAIQRPAIERCGHSSAHVVSEPKVRSGRLVSTHLTEDGAFRAWQLATRAEELSPLGMELKRMLHNSAREAAHSCRR